MVTAIVVAANADQPSVSPDSFSFTLDGVASRDVLAGWKRKHSKLAPPAEPDCWVPRYAESLAELERADFVTYRSETLDLAAQRETFPDADAWIQFVTFANNSQRDSGIIADVYPLDTVLRLDGDGPIVLRYAKGSHNEQTDFQPMEASLVAGKPLTFSPYGGRSSDGFLPFFNLSTAHSGYIIGIAWTGQWKATFEAIDERSVRVTAGMERARFRLAPKEAARTPGVLALRWEGRDWLAGQNQLRRFLLRHFTPRLSGAPVVPPIAASPNGYVSFNDVTQANLIDCVERVASHAFPVDTFWLDAGWNAGGFPLGMGNPEPDAARFPNGLKPVSDAAHARGLKYLQWFEPERVMPGTWLDTQHPEWLLKPAGLPPELAYHEKDGFRLLDLGNDDARAWITSKISSQVSAYGVDVYRHDFNLFPLYYWRNDEPEDRQGIREIRYIEGLYDFFDTLRRDHPDLVIDNCASGGRRLDLEMLRRCVFLWRTDNCWDPIAEQCMTHALSLWLPVHGVGAVSVNPYEFRSGLGSSFTMALDYRSENPAFWEQATARVNELKRVREFFSKDYYPLSPYTTAEDAWIAWQFHDPEKDAGLVQAFRRGKAPDATLHLRLRGLGEGATYTLTNLDTSADESIAGGRLMAEGFGIRIDEAPGSAVIVYARGRGRN